MKTPLFISQRAKTGLILVISTALLAQDAQCESRLKRALGAIKERIGHALNKSDDDVDSRKNQRVKMEQSLVNDQSRTLEYKTNSRTAPRQLSSNSYDANSNAWENPASASVSQPSVTYSKPKQSIVSSANPAVSEQQRANASSPPPLRELPLDFISPSPSTSMVQGSKGDSQSQASTTETPIKYAAPVAGHPGFVYPPGIAAEPKNMLDVRGFAAGEKMRDPRTGEVFLVPEEHFVFSEVTKLNQTTP